MTSSHQVADVFLAFLKLGCTSFGGPIAHIGYFRHEFVERRRWVEEAAYADLVALCNFLPGPASSQLGIALGIHRAGLAGGLAAWLGFTLPSALALIAFAYGVQGVATLAESGWLHGLKLMAVAVVAQAVWGMAKNLCPDVPRAAMALAATAWVTAWSGPVAQLAVIGAGAIAGFALRPTVQPIAQAPLAVPYGRGLALSAWGLYFGLLFLLPVAALVSGSEVLRVLEGFYRAGALVFGGGHVVLPLLHGIVVPTGWVSDSTFLAGYGAAQAVPGPLFTFAAYLGAAMSPVPGGVVGGLMCLCAIFLPAFLLIVGALPYWAALRGHGAIRSAMSGINAAVVGILLGALYDPVWTGSVHGIGDMCVAAVAFCLLVFAKLSPLTVVVFAALGGGLLTLL